MKKITTSQGVVTESPVNTATARKDAPIELVKPDEFEALLNSFDDLGPVPVQSDQAACEIQIETEDLWEKLSSTRWLKEREKPEERSENDDLSNKSTVARR